MDNEQIIQNLNEIEISIKQIKSKIDYMPYYQSIEFNKRLDRLATILDNNLDSS
jgi:hypothetical protein